MNNMDIYTKLQTTPKEAQKTIAAGRLKGFTDINPMWRIKALTETFGPCGIGWWFEILDKRLNEADGEIKAFVDINLFYVYEGQTSKPLFGSGGASFVSKYENGIYVSDECFKMALTDAIGSACKLLGMSGDIYFANDKTKYTGAQEEKPKSQTKREIALEKLDAVAKMCGCTKNEAFNVAKSSLKIEKPSSDKDYQAIIEYCDGVLRNGNN